MPETTNAPSNYRDIIGLLMPLCAAAAKLSDNAAADSVSGRPERRRRNRQDFSPRRPESEREHFGVVVVVSSEAAAAVIKMPSGDVFGA